MANEIQELKFQVGEAWKGVYSPSTAYGLANVVQDPTGLSIYRSLKSGNVGHPVTDASWWFRIIDMSSIKAESDRIAALNQAIAQDEALRVAAEELRQQHEAERVAAETQRNEAEQQRISAEQARVNAESARATAEQQRITAEQGRVSAESARVTAEQARVLAETLRANAEDQRAANEQNRVAAEQQRIERAEQDHQRAESDHATYVDSLGAFDISSYHATDGVLAKYADLTAALGTNGANIPDDLRKGGMSVKFVQSSDNNYVQFRYMGTAVTGNPNPFLNEANWSFCGDDQIIECNEYIHVKTDAEGKILWAIKTDGKIYYGAGVPQQIVDYINEKIAELSLDEYEDIVAFLNGIEEGDKTIQQLLNEKVDTEEGKSLIDETFASTQEAIESPEYLEVSVDSENKIIEGTKTDGTKHITGDLQVDGNIINPGIQGQIDDAIEDMQEQVDEALESAEEIISYFDSVENPELLEVKTDSDGKVIAGRDKNGRAKEFVGLDAKELNADEVIANSVAAEESTVGIIEVGEEIILSDEAKGKLKEELNVEDGIPYNDSIFTNGRIIKVYNPYKNGGNNQYTGQMHCHSWSYVRYNGVLYKVPIGYNVEDIAAMTEEQRNAAVLSVNTQFVAAHKDVGYDFMTITNYDTFADFTEAPSTLPENFIWLGNGFEANTGGWDSTGQAEDQGAHICVINTNFGKVFDGFETKDVIKYAEDRGAVCNYAHPFISCLYSSPEYVRQIKSRLRFIEVFNGLSYYHSDVAPNVPPVKPGIEIDEDFDALLSQGNFVFGTAVSDHRNLGTSERDRNFLKTGCVKVFANELTHKAIWEAMLSGNFYCTEFADYELLGVSLIGNVYAINVGEADVTVEFLNENNNILSTVVTTSGNTVASYAIQGTEKFVRARLYQPYEDPTYTYNHKKRQMWTQPIFLAKEIL